MRSKRFWLDAFIKLKTHTQCRRHCSKNCKCSAYKRTDKNHKRTVHTVIKLIFAKNETTYDLFTNLHKSVRAHRLESMRTSGAILTFEFRIGNRSMYPLITKQHFPFISGAWRKLSIPCHHYGPYKRLIRDVMSDIANFMVKY